MRPISKVFAAVAILGLVGASRASVVVEAEADGMAANNTIPTAQFIASSDFTVPAPPTVFSDSPTATILGRGGGDDIDFYTFMLASTAPVLFDIDDDPFTFDTNLALFDATGTLVGFDDDSDPVDPGSVDARDSFLGVILLTAGTYHVAITEFSNFASALLGPNVMTTDLLRPDLGFGGRVVTGADPGDSTFFFDGPQPVGSLPYTLHITIVPEPGGLALAGPALLAALGAAWRRRGRSKLATRQ